MFLLALLIGSIAMPLFDFFSEDGVQLKLKESNYIDCLAESYCLRQFVFMKVEETDQVECMFEDFILQKPHLELEASAIKIQCYIYLASLPIMISNT